MDPVLGSLLVAAIQAIAAAAKQYGLSKEEADKYFLDGYEGVKANLPGNLPDVE